MSKGSTPRPFNIPQEQYRNQWDEIFGKKPQPEKPTNEQSEHPTSPIPHSPG